jgi:isopenicillin-N N-acyltransferase like protein
MKFIRSLFLISLFFCASCNEETKTNLSYPSIKEVINPDLSSIQVIKLKGTAFEIGFQHGKALKDEIHDLVSLWKHDIEVNYNTSADEFIKEFLSNTNYVPAIKEWTPELFDEIKGISQGSEIELNTILAFQFIDEIWANGNAIMKLHHCTSLGINNRIKNDSVNYIAQNLDVTPFYHKYKTLLDIEYEGSDVKNYIVTFPGYIGTNGINQNIGITVNSLLDIENSTDGLPVCCVVRGVLQKKSFNEAKTFLKIIKHASGQNYIIGSKNNIESFECSATKVSSYWPDSTKSNTYHANDALSNNSYSQNYVTYLKDSLKTTPTKFGLNNFRLKSLKSRISNQNKINLDTIKQILKSKDNSIDPICNVFTWVSTIMEFHDSYNVLLISPGKPDSTSYLEFIIK